MNLPLEPGERILKLGEARFVAGERSAPGLLVATTLRLVFVTQDGRALVIPAEQIEGVAPANRLGVLPAGLFVGLAGGRTERFDVARRGEWTRLVDRLRTGDVAGLPTAPEALARPGPIEPVVSWPAVMAWIAAPFALVPLLGLLPTLALLVAAALLLARPRRLHDRKAGAAALALGALALGALAFAALGVWRAGPIDLPGDGGVLRLTTALKVVQVAVLVLSIVLHECGHALAAYWSGDETSVRLKRLTLNPIRHVDLFGSLVLPGILIASGSPAVFGWAKPVPLNLANLRSRLWGNLAVSLAGVSANLLVAMTATSLLLALGVALDLLAPGATVRGIADLVASTHVSGVAGAAALAFAADVLKMAVIVNLVLFAFNLLPVPPLDGSHVLEALLPGPVAGFFAKLRPYGMILLVVLIFAGVTGWIVRAALTVGYGLLAVAGALCGVG